MKLNVVNSTHLLVEDGDMCDGQTSFRKAGLVNLGNAFWVLIDCKAFLCWKPLMEVLLSTETLAK